MCVAEKADEVAEVRCTACLGLVQLLQLSNTDPRFSPLWPLMTDRRAERIAREAPLGIHNRNFCKQ
jgi:hypothetical protein